MIFLETNPPGLSGKLPTSTSSLETAEEADLVPEEAVMIAEVDCVEIAGVVLIVVCEVMEGAEEEEVEEEGVTGSLPLLPLLLLPGDVSTPSASSLLFLFWAI